MSLPSTTRRRDDTTELGGDVRYAFVFVFYLLDLGRGWELGKRRVKGGVLGPRGRSQGGKGYVLGGFVGRMGGSLFERLFVRGDYFCRWSSWLWALGGGTCMFCLMRCCQGCY